MEQDFFKIQIFNFFSSVLHDLECNGNESHITDCHFGNHQTHTHECTGLEKAGLK